MATQGWLGEVTGTCGTGLAGVTLAVRAIAGDVREASSRIEHSPGTWVRVSAQGVVVEVLAPANTATSQIYTLAAEHGLDPLHSDAVMAEAAAWVARPGLSEPDLVDLRHLPLVTIDEVTSRDLDQALCLEREGDGYVVWYAIADASWFVRPGTALFREALRRGATAYLPGLVVPMLPAVLSEDLVSLNPGVQRRALVFRMSLDRVGRLRGYEISRAMVRSRAKLDYDGVDAWLGGRASAPTDDPAVVESLHILPEVGELRIRLADERDVLRLRRTQTRVSVGDGMSFVAFSDARNLVEKYNEQISLLCNMVGAEHLRDSDADFVQAIFRVHPAPQAARVTSLRERIDAILAARQMSHCRWREDTSLADYLAGLPHEGAEGRLARAIHRQAMMINGRSGFSSVPGVHFGVGAALYGRFSAPMREIVGIFVHKQVWETLEGRALAEREGARTDEALVDEVIAVSERTRQLQRKLDHQVNALVLDQLFRGDLDRERAPRRPATVMGISRSKVHVQLDDLALDVKIYRRHLQQQASGSLQMTEGVSVGVEGRADPLAVVGDRVHVWVRGRDGDRWSLGLAP